MSKVAVFGAGYVGLVTGACFAELGHQVVVRDVLPERIELLRAGEVPIYEPELAELIARNPERLAFTLDVAEAVSDVDFLYVAVGTPPTYSGDADLSAVWTVVDELAGLEKRAVLVMKSTVPVGTGARVRHRLDQSGLDGIGYASNPEFTAEGTAVRDFQHPDRIVIGAFEDADGDAVEELHRGIDAPIVRSDVASAEMIKLAANAALMTRISFINEIANVCEATGADVVRVAEGVGLDRRIGSSFLRAGLGYGGSCFPKDSLALKQLAANSGYHFQLLNAVIEVNELQKRRVIGKLQNQLGTLRGKKVALLGLAFKPNTDDMREAPSLVLAGRLVAEGADVRAWDPVARVNGLHGVEQVETIEQALVDVDAAILVTEWPQLEDVDWTAAAAGAHGRRCLVDGRNMLDPNEHARRGMDVRRHRPRGRLWLGVSLTAVILVGGLGTRLRPLTDQTRKDMLPLVDRPQLAYTFEHFAARRHARDRLVRLPADADPGALRRPRTASCSSSTEIEEEPLGTGGAIRFAAQGLDEPFFALNGDSLREPTSTPSSRFIASAATRATILLTPVEDPSRYGLVRVNAEGRVVSFLEKPQPEEIDTNLINAGLYVLEPDVLDLIPADRPVSIEREIFPQLVEEDAVAGVALPGYWLDVGTPDAYLSRRTGTCWSRTTSPSSARSWARTTRSSPKAPT